jgi:hypothetical protein
VFQLDIYSLCAGGKRVGYLRLSESVDIQSCQDYFNWLIPETPLTSHSYNDILGFYHIDLAILTYVVYTWGKPNIPPSPQWEGACNTLKKKLPPPKMFSWLFWNSSEEKRLKGKG